MTASPLNYAWLAGHWLEGRDYEIHAIQRSSEVLVLAPHGGGIEPGTSEIAKALAGDEHSLYCFDGLLEDRNWDLHISSLCFDEARCLRLLEQARKVIAVHGCRGNDPVIWVGGLDEGLKRRMFTGLQQAGFDARLDTSGHAGVNPLSLCNRTRSGMGLQLEISLGQRQQFFAGLARPLRRSCTSSLERFSRAVRTSL